MKDDDRKLVLVVDADARFIDSTRSLLQPHRTLTARDLDEAREIVLGGRVDVVVLGAAFASEHSVEQARTLRDADPSAAIVLAADIVTNRLLKAALRAGFADVVDLPLTTDAFGTLLALDSHPAQEIELILEAAAPDAVQDGTRQSDVATPEQLSNASLEETVGAGDISTPSAFETDEVVEPRVAAADILPWGAAPAPKPRPVPSPPEPTLDPAPPTDLTAPPVWPTDPSEPAPHPDEPQSESTPHAPSFEPDPVVDPEASDVTALPVDPPPAPLPDSEPADPVRHRSGTGRVIAVMAGKGGSGKSVVATNLAVAMGLRSDPERVAIVDADLQFGDVALMLQVDPVRTIDDVIGQLDSLSDARLDGALLRHESGLRVLPAPLLPVRSGEIPHKAVVEVVDRLRGLFDTIIVDTGPVFDDGLVTILEHADAVVTVVDMDLPSVKNAKVALDALRSGGFPMERITLVVNRVNSKARLDLAELERSLGLRVGGSVPSDRLVPQSVNEGIPLLALSPRSKVARSFMALAERLDPRAERDRLGGGDR